MKFVSKNSELDRDLKSIGVIEKAGNVLSAFTSFVKSGGELSTAEEKERRSKICDACELWKPSGNLGFGECTAPGCGCTKAKAWIAASTCTHPQGSRW